MISQITLSSFSSSARVERLFFFIYFTASLIFVNTLFVKIQVLINYLEQTMIKLKRQTTRSPVFSREQRI